MHTHTPIHTITHACKYMLTRTCQLLSPPCINFSNAITLPTSFVSIHYLWTFRLLILHRSIPSHAHTHAHMHTHTRTHPHARTHRTLYPFPLPCIPRQTHTCGDKICIKILAKQTIMLMGGSSPNLEFALFSWGWILPEAIITSLADFISILNDGFW